MFDTGLADANVQAWQALESTWYPTEFNFNGCGYIGTEDDIEPVKFGDGCTGCTDADSAYGSTDLLWLWIVLGCVGAILIALGIFYCLKKSKAEQDAKMLAHS